MTNLTSRFDEAFRYAREAHHAQTRKGTETPYIGHLMGVASIVLDDGGTEIEAMAALLHDAPEDQGGRERLADIRQRFGEEVARIVEDCTDCWDTPKKPWIERKQAYVKHARTLGPSSLRVSAADKVHNAYAILRDLRNTGEAVWARFSATPDDIMSYYEALVRAYRAAPALSLSPFDAAQGDLERVERSKGAAMSLSNGPAAAGDGSRLVDELDRIVRGIRREMGY